MNESLFHNPENEIYERINNMPNKVNCAKVGKILESNPDRTVTVGLLDGIKVNCILFCLAAASGFIDFEDYIGSDCVVVFSDDDLTRYKLQNETLDELDARKHTLNNGIALSGVFPFNKRPKFNDNPGGKNHFVSFEQLDEILKDWTGKINAWQSDLADALGAATIAQAPSGTMPITFVLPMPQATDAIDIAESKIGGIVHND